MKEASTESNAASRASSHPSSAG